MPLGELFDLEALGAYCQETGRWSFFFVSKPNFVSSPSSGFRVEFVNGLFEGAGWYSEPSQYIGNLLGRLGTVTDQKNLLLGF
jgi:hypothetical protein